MTSLQELMASSEQSSSESESDVQVGDTCGDLSNDSCDDDFFSEANKATHAVACEDNNEHAVACEDNNTHAVASPEQHNCVETIEENAVLTQRDWRQKFIKANPLYRRCKIRYSKYCYIKPRCALPATGKPVLYVAEGAENWTGKPSLLCPGQLIFLEDQKWVILAVMWVGCLSRRKNNTTQYCPQSKGMKVLLCPQQVFDKVTDDLREHESDLRYVLIDVYSLLFF